MGDRLFSEPTLRAVTVAALETFLVEVRAIDCDTSVFCGVSGGRAALLPLLEEVEASCSSGPNWNAWDVHPSELWQ